MKSRFVLIALLATAPCLVRAQVTQSELGQRRDSVLARTGDGIVLALGSPEPAEDYFTGPAPRDPTKVEWYRGTGR